MHMHHMRYVDSHLCAHAWIMSLCMWKRISNSKRSLTWKLYLHIFHVCGKGECYVDL